MTHALSPGFRRVRTGVFAITTFVSVLWTILLSAEIFVLYDTSDPAQRNLVAVLIFVNAVTAIMLPVLSIFQFRVWLDAARLLFLLLIHIGTAVLFTVWNPTFNCPHEPSQRKVCQNVNVAILVCSWVVPTLLVWYAVFLAVSYRLWHKDQKEIQEVSEKRLSELPMMVPSARRPSLVPGQDNKLSANVSSMPSGARKPVPPPLQLPPRMLPPGAQPPTLPNHLLAQTSQPPSQRYQPQTGQQQTGYQLQAGYQSQAHGPSPSNFSNSQSSYSQHSSRVTSTRWSQPHSIIPAYYSSQVSPRNSHNSRPSLTLQASGLPPSQLPSARPPSHLPSPRPPSHAPSPSTSSSQGHSRSSSHARLLALALPHAMSTDETSDDSSPRSSGRLSKPAPWAS